MVLSVIVPVYNTQAFLKQCYESIVPLLETQEVELIFVNDGSTDDSLAVLEEFKSQQETVVIVNQKNAGLSAARNTGIQHARGAYVLLVDSDDWITSDAVLKVYQLAVQHELDVAAFKLQFVDEQMNITGESYNQPVPLYKVFAGREALIGGYQPSSACLFLYRTAFLKDNKLTFYKGIMQEDVEFTVRLMIHAQKIMFTPVVCYNYYRRSDSMTTTFNIDRIKIYLKDSIEVARLIKNNLNTIGSSDAMLYQAIQQNYNSVVWNLIWRFVSMPKEVDKEFKVNCLKWLKKKELYPIRGPLKSNFQRVSRLFFNSPTLMKLVFSWQS